MATNDEDLFEFNSAGAESEEDVPVGLGSRVSKAVLWSTDWTIETIYRQLEKKNIELNPEFQRREAWDNKKKSLFIESLFLGLPIPQIVLAERPDNPGSYIVIDGKQRLLTIRRFFAGENDPEFDSFKLEGLRVMRDFNDHTFAQLAEDPKRSGDIRFFENQTFRTTIIRNWPNEDFLYMVFHRLNTGSVPLSPQELRQALHPGPFLSFADKFTQTSSAISRLLRKDKPDFRMRDVELFVRFFAFKRFMPSYKGNLKLFLDEACYNLNRKWSGEQAECEKLAAKLEAAVGLTFDIFGDDGAFRKWSSNGFETKFNRAIFDVMVYYFADLNKTTTMPHAKAIRIAFQKLCKDDAEFLKSIESTTKSIQATGTRLEKWGKALKSILKKPLKIPRYINDRIVLA